MDERIVEINKQTWRPSRKRQQSVQHKARDVHAPPSLTKAKINKTDVGGI